MSDSQTPPVPPTATPGPAAPVPETSPFQKAVKNAIRGEAPPEPAASPPAGNDPPKPPEPTKAGEPPKPPSDDDVPDNFTQAKAAHWNKLKGDRDQWKTKATEYEKKMAELNSEVTKLKPTLAEAEEIKKRFESTTKERDTYASIVERQAMSEDPRFQARYDKPLEQKLASAKTLAGDKGEQLAALLVAPDGKWRNTAMKELLADMDPFDTGRIATIIGQYDDLRAERASLLADSKEQMRIAREMEATKRTEQQKQDAAKREARIAEVLEGARKYETFKDDGEQTKLKKLLGGEVDWQTFADTAVKGIDYQRLEKQLDTITKERDEAKAAIAELTKGNPGMRGSGQQQDGGAAGQPVSFKDKVKQAMKSV